MGEVAEGFNLLKPQSPAGFLSRSLIGFNHSKGHVDQIVNSTLFLKILQDWELRLVRERLFRTLDLQIHFLNFEV